MTPALYPAFSFVPPVHFQKHGNPPAKMGPIVGGNLMSSCHLKRKANAGVRCLVLSPHGLDKGRRWVFADADAAPSPFARHSGSHGQTGVVFPALRETAFSLLTLSQFRPWGNAHFFSLSFGLLAAQSGSGLPPGNRRIPGGAKADKVGQALCLPHPAGR